MYESPGYSVVIVFVLKWRRICYLEKRRGIVGATGFFKKGSKGGHEQTMATTTAVVDPTVWPWQPAFELLARLCGQRTPRAARGESHGP